MEIIAIPPNMIYNVYQRGDDMQVTVSKWGNSLGIRIPTSVVDALSIKNGDNINYEVNNNTLILKKEKSTRQMFEEFYGKSLEELSIEDLGPGGELDWGEDVGGEII